MRALFDVARYLAVFGLGMLALHYLARGIEDRPYLTGAQGWALCRTVANYTHDYPAEGVERTKVFRRCIEAFEDGAITVDVRGDLTDGTK